MSNITMDLKLQTNDESNNNVIEALKSKDYHNVKISTSKFDVKMDRKDERYISTIHNVKVIIKLQDDNILILFGNIGCSFNNPFGGEFFLKKYHIAKNDYNSIRGVEASINFVTIEEPSSIDEMHHYLYQIANHDDFNFNLSQFDEFMDVFNFYKKISNDLNNNFTYNITKISKPYYFVPFDIKDFERVYLDEVKDINGVLKGYKLEESDYEFMPNSIKENILEVIDIYIDGDSLDVAKINRIGSENVYLCNHYNISEKNIKDLKQFNIINIRMDKKGIILSGEMKSSSFYNENYKYLNLYDMGQKIKIESIDNSLRLINQGATGSASELIEYLIGDKEMPNNYGNKRINNAKAKYIEGLNESQIKAFLMATDGSPVSLIKGPPGTGKTHVINAIVQYITKELNEKVVVSSQTHIAIDNVLDKLVSNYDLIVPNRITNRRNKYSEEYIDYTLYNTWASKFNEHNKHSKNIELANEIASIMKSFKGEKRFKYSELTSTNEFSVIGATTTTSAIAGKKGLEILEGYDWLIIDEVSKCPITEVLRFLPYVSKVILVGDDYQLAPLLEFTKDDVKTLPSYNEDMFDKLQTIYEQSVFAKVLNKAKRANRLVVLDENYRSVSQILNTYNVFYDGKLKGKRELVNPDKCRFSEKRYDDKDVIFVEVKRGQEQKDGTSRFNIEEIDSTSLILEELIKTAINPSNVTVSAIFPYAAQINRFQKKNINLINEAKKVFKSFEIDTIDAFQGKETNIVLVNTVVTDLSQKNFLNDFRRINVSMSRAKDKLIIFGNKITLSKIKMKAPSGGERCYFKDIIDYITSSGTIIKYDGGKITDEIKRKSTLKFA